MRDTVVSSRRGVSTFELLLVVIILGLAAATVTPAYFASHRDAQLRECSYRLAVIQDAKREVMEEMNRRLPVNRRLRITDRVNPLHLDMIAQKALASPWRFHPEDSFAGCGTLSVGKTFLDPPSSSTGAAIATFHTAEAQ
jgi:type II secretory pathway pseudopilin PulG